MSLIKINSVIALLILLAISGAQAETLRDPTRPGHGAIVASSTSTEVDTSLILNSVVKAKASSYAVINNKIFSLGDRVQGVTITAIDTISVSLSDGRRLTMYQAVIETKGN